MGFNSVGSLVFDPYGHPYSCVHTPPHTHTQEETPTQQTLACPASLTPYWVPKPISSLRLHKQDTTQNTVVPGSQPGSWWT